MCGRYRLSRRKQLIEEYFETENEVDWEPRYNIAPSQPVGIIRQDPSKPERHFSLARWGLIPSWATDSSIGFKTINARAETVADKPAFRDAFVSRRCLLPADGFFEWSRRGKEKQPFHFGMQDDSLFAFAGLWDRWKDPSGTVIESCTVLTTTPNSLLTDVHDRMPVILRRDNYDLWLDPGFKDVKALAEVLAPFDASLMRSFPVSSRINAVANDDPACVVPWQPDSPLKVLFSGSTAAYPSRACFTICTNTSLVCDGSITFLANVTSIPRTLCFQAQVETETIDRSHLRLMCINASRPIYQQDEHILMVGIHLDEATTSWHWLKKTCSKH